MRRDAFAAGGSAALARKEDRSAQVFGRAFAGGFAGRKLLRERHSTRSFDFRSQSRSRSFRGFSTAPRASCRDAKNGVASAALVSPRLTPQGLSVGRRRATSSSSISPPTDAKDWPADSTITTLADTR